MTTTARPHERGFTLSETLAALAVAGVGLSLAVPGLQSLAERNQTVTAVNRLVTTAHLARSVAITRNVPVAVCASQDGEHCDGRQWADGWIAFVDADANQARAAAEDLLDRAGPLDSLELVSPEYPDRFAYRGDGRIEGADAATGGGEFVFCAPGAAQLSRVVIIRASGAPTLAAHRRDGSITGCQAT